MKFRKLACTVLAGAAVLGLAACGNSGGSKDAAKSGGDVPKQKSLGGHSQYLPKKKLVTVLELMKNQSSKRLKKQTQI